MKNKTFVLVVIVLIATLVTATPALAWYSSVSGTARNSVDYSAWTHGGTVTVWDCTDIGGTALGSDPTISTSDGTFSAPVSGAPTFPPGYLCVQIQFNDPPGPNPAPGDKWLVIQSLSGPGDQGDYNAGYVYTDTGPNAVTLADANAESPNVWLAVALAVGALVGAGGVALLLRRRRIA